MRSFSPYALAALSLLVSATAFHAAPAHAQKASLNAEPEYLPDTDTDRDEHARSEFELGRKAYEDGDYRGAWQHFHDSYELSHRPELLYNIGQTADRLRMDKDAVTAFRQYLDQLPNADNRREVENRVRALEERMQQEGSAGAPAGEAASDQAQPAAAESAPTPPGDPQPTRRGWYFRVGLGLGLRRDGISDKAAFDATLSGAGLSGEFSAGLAVMPGVVVGGGAFFDWTSSPSISVGSAKAVDLDSANLSMIGPMIDWYLEPQFDGLHFQGALTLAAATFSPKGTAAGTNTASGAALLLGGGYEWTLTDAVGIGALGRLSLAGLSHDPYSHGFFAASALCTLTWY